MDLIRAQAAYVEALRGAEMVCVDINPAVETKLSDCGSLESMGVVTDVGLFLRLLVRQLGPLEPRP